MVSDEMADPVGPEFRKTFDEQNFGLPLKDSLANLIDGMPLLDVRFFATAVLIQRDTGGNLAEIRRTSRRSSASDSRFCVRCGFTRRTAASRAGS